MDFNEVFNDMITAASQENKEIILLGDLNCDYSKRTDNSCLKDIIIIQPTRITMTTSSLIDIVLTAHVGKFNNLLYVRMVLVIMT